MVWGDCPPGRRSHEITRAIPARGSRRLASATAVADNGQDGQCPEPCGDEARPAGGDERKARLRPVFEDCFCHGFDIVGIGFIRYADITVQNEPTILANFLNEVLAVSFDLFGSAVDHQR
jgi:hypothetical protein